MTAPLSAAEFFQRLNPNSMHLVAEFYAPDVHFVDPVHEARGVEAMRRYYEDLYKKVESVDFTIERSLKDAAGEEVLFWQMRLKAKGLNGGNEIVVSGNSHFVRGGAEAKVTYHRDYFDMGAFVYEQLPVLGFIVRQIKKRLAGAN